MGRRGHGRAAVGPATFDPPRFGPKGKAIGGVKVSDEDMLATALRLRDEEHLSLREIASRLVIRTGRKRGRHPAPATVMRMLREHDEQAVTAADT